MKTQKEIPELNDLRSRSEKVKERSLTFLFRLLFGRAMITILLIVLQVIILMGVLQWMGQYSDRFLLIMTVMSVLVIVYIVNSKQNPAFKLAWMMPVCAFPVFGTFLFLFIQINPGSIGLRKGLQKRILETEEFLHTEKEVLQDLKKEKADIRELSCYLQNINGMPAYQATEAVYFPVGEDKFADLLVELEKAEKFIFMEYFIISRGLMWNAILDILKRKAAEGVEVRVMYDGMNSIVNLPYNYKKELEKYGIKAKVFSQIKPFLSTHQNNRDHRKILVIDGEIAYTGGVNLADEYINEKVKFGHWKDMSIRLRGKAVKSFTLMFLQMWNLNERGREDYAKYITVEEDITNKEFGYAIPYNDDPTNKQDVASRVYMDMLNRAEEYVHIVTPYLILDNEMMVALCFAAERGVEVKIIMPHIPDKRFAFDIARTHYMQLLAAGVKIYEYKPGFVHGKVFVSDDCKAVVGSINLDFRSLYSHFECAVYIYKNPVVADVELDFHETLSKCIEMTPELYKKIPLRKRITGHVFRIFAPLM